MGLDYPVSGVILPISDPYPTPTPQIGDDGTLRIEHYSAAIPTIPVIT